MKRIEVCAAKNQDTGLDGFWDLVNDNFETLADARKYAKRVLTDSYQALCEASEPLGYSQVRLNGECVSDYFRK